MARNFPSMLEYQEAIQTPQAAFADPELKGGTVVLDALGLPRPITGGFASVYQVKNKTKHFAVRCFLRPPSSVAERYSKISAFVAQHRPGWMTAFEYLDQGIKVQGKWYPILKMEWIQGEPFNLYVARLVGQKKPLLKLADRFLELLADMAKRSVAHGDLQHGNILVAQDRLRLIDYDAMFIEGMTGQSAEVGHRNYQHPKRSERDFGPHLDHFSAWVILTSLKALAHDPKLWLKLDGGDEGLLFRKEDFVDPDQSKAFREIGQIKDPDLQSLLTTLRDALKVPCQDVRSPCAPHPPPKASAPAASAPKTPTGVASSTVAAGSGFKNPLSHVSQFLSHSPHKKPSPKKTSTPSHQGQGGTALSGSSQQLAPNYLIDRAGLSTALLAAGWTTLALTTRSISSDLAMLCFCLTGLGLTLVLWLRYSTLPLVRKKRQLLRELEHLDEDLEACTAKLDALQNLEREIQKTHKLNLPLLRREAPGADAQALMDRFEEFLQKQRWESGKIPGIDDDLCRSLRKQGFKHAALFDDMIVTRSMSDGETLEKITLLLTTGRQLVDPQLSRKTAPAIFAWRRQGEVKFVTDTKVEYQILQGDLQKKKLETTRAADLLDWVNGPEYLKLIMGLKS